MRRKCVYDLAAARRHRNGTFGHRHEHQCAVDGSLGRIGNGTNDVLGRSIQVFVCDAEYASLIHERGDRQRQLEPRLTRDEPQSAVVCKNRVPTQSGYLFLRHLRLQSNRGRDFRDQQAFEEPPGNIHVHANGHGLHQKRLCRHDLYALL